MYEKDERKTFARPWVYDVKLSWIKSLAVGFVYGQDILDHFALAQFHDKVFVLLGVEVHAAEFGLVKPVITARLHDSLISKTDMFMKTFFV